MDFVENLSGSGQVFDGDKKVADVAYDINVYQDRVNTSSHDGNSSIPGLKTVVLHLDEPVGPVGRKLTLVLNDGRKLDFLVRAYNNFALTGPIA